MIRFYIGLIIGMIYQLLLIYLLVDTDDDIMQFALISLETCSIMLFLILALREYIL